MNIKSNIKTNIKSNINSLTPWEKAKLLQGTNFMYTNRIERLNIPTFCMSDGPHGLRKQIGSGDNGVSKSEIATSFPTEVNVALSWNVDNAYKMGQAIGEECRYYNVNMLLGPGLNIKRNPLGGRCFEYYSEDPLLNGKLGASFIRGIESEKVAACVKHFACNNQENFRFIGNSLVDERTLREIYLKPFEIAVKEGRPSGVMTAYNMINGTFAGENKWLITDVLRNEWGFDGIVMSDWGGTNDRIKGIEAGEDLEMPGDTTVSVKKVYDAINHKTIDEDKLNDCLERILKVNEKYVGVEKYPTIDWDAHHKLAVDIAIDSGVLLKNKNNILPLNQEEKILVIGELFNKMRYQGSGSSMINPKQVMTHAEAFEKRQVKYEYVQGYQLMGAIPDNLIDEAINKVQDYDKIVVYLGLDDITESEGGDRENMRLPLAQLQLMEKLTKLNKKIVVILFAGSVVELPFINDIDGLLNMGLPGQGIGEATAQLLYGEASPSGKLVQTWPINYTDIPYASEFSKEINELYKESIYVGYRYFDKFNIPTLFDFGFGLSYTKFAYQNLNIINKDDEIEVKFTLKNIGTFAGSEVVQIYVKNNEDSKVFKVKKQLVAFTKVYLKVDEEQEVICQFKVNDLAYYNVKEKRFILETGEYEIEVNSSYHQVELSKKIIITGEQCDSPYSDELNDQLNNHQIIDNQTFEELIGYQIPCKISSRTLTMDTKFSDFKKRFLGKILYNAVSSVAKKQLKKAKKLPEGVEKENTIKGAVFLQRIFDTNCLRTLSMSAGKSFPYNLAEGMMEISNGHIIKGVIKMCKPYKIKQEVEVKNNEK